MVVRFICVYLAVIIFGVPGTRLSQIKTYPKEIRGYKVHRGAADNQIQLIKFGDASVARVTPLGITLEIPVVVSPVEQKGRVDFLVFENMIVNGTSVEIDEYHRAFDLPNDKPITLKEPLRFFVYLPRAVLAAIDELSASAKEWPITGVVYVFGRFKKGIFRFKRVIPVEINFITPNPLHKK